MSKKNENKLINACIRKNKEIKKLKKSIVDILNENVDLKIELVNLIEAFQILQKILDFEFAFGINDRKFLICKNLVELNNIDYELLRIAIERYGIK